MPIKLFKTYKNTLGRIDLYRGLYVIWQYFVNLHNNVPFPSDIMTSLEYIRQSKDEKRLMIAEWDLELLALYLLVYSTPNSYPKESFEDYNYFTLAINKQKELENEIGKTYKNKLIFESELFRLSYKQFPYQIDGEDMINFLRSYEIFNTHIIEDLFKQRYQLSLFKFYAISIFLFFTFINKFSVPLPLRSEISGLTIEDINKYITLCTVDIEQCKDIKDKEINNNFSYIFNPLREKPFINIFSDGIKSLACPIPLLLYWRFQQGIYYDLIKESFSGHKKFGEEFGKSFQNYVGKICNFVLGKDFKIISESKYFKDNKLEANTIDWRVESNTAILFIECKTKRFNLQSRITLIEEHLRGGPLFEELGKLADSIVQIYTTLNDYLNCLYKDSFSTSLLTKSIYPILVTYTDLFLHADFIKDELNRLTIVKFKEKGLEEGMLTKYPLKIFSINSFETLIILISKAKNINEIISNTDKYNNHDIDSFMNQKYPQYFPIIKTSFFDKSNIDLAAEILRKIAKEG